MSTIAFLGLGHMGGPMAKNLVAAGHTVRGFDLVPAAQDAARAAGVTVIDTAEEAVTGADAVVTMLPNGGIVKAVYESVLPHAAPGTLFIDSSTISVDDARAVHALAEAAGMQQVDAPVSGGVKGADAGTLAFMVGGDDAAFAARVRELTDPGLARQRVLAGLERIREHTWADSARDLLDLARELHQRG